MSDTTPAAPAAENVETAGAPTPAAPNPAATPETTTPPQQTDTTSPAEIDDDTLLGADDDGDEGPADAEETEQAEERTPLAPWQPPEGMEISEHAKPHLEALDSIATDEAQRDKIIGLYDQMVQAQVARLAEADKSATKAAVEAVGGKDAYAPLLQSAKTVMRSWPQELRDAVRDARTSDGRRLALMPEFVRALASMGAKSAATNQPGDRRMELQRELADLEAMRDSNIDAYRSTYRNTGKSGADRALEILRELNGDKPKRPSAVALQTEEAELLELYRTNQPVFEYAPWKNTGLTGAERLTRIRQGRA